MSPSSTPTVAPTLSPTEACEGMIITTSVPNFAVEGHFRKLKNFEYVFNNITDKNHHQLMSIDSCPNSRKHTYFYFDLTKNKWILKGFENKLILVIFCTFLLFLGCEHQLMLSEIPPEIVAPENFLPFHVTVARYDTSSVKDKKYAIYLYCYDTGFPTSWLILEFLVIIDSK